MPPTLDYDTVSMVQMENRGIDKLETVLVSSAISGRVSFYFSGTRLDFKARFLKVFRQLPLPMDAWWDFSWCLPKSFSKQCPNHKSTNKGFYIQRFVSVKAQRNCHSYLI